MISPNDIAALWLTLKLACISTLILILFGAPLAWWLSRSTSRFVAIIETLITLPLVLPPTVIGFYLLLAFSPDSPFASGWHKLFGRDLAFSFEGLVIGSVIYSLPFVVQPLQRSYEQISRQLLFTAASLGAKPLDRICSIILPLSRRATIAAAMLAFTHTIGEFGIVLMIGGNIVGETQVLSVALFDHVEALDYGNAHKLALLLIGFSFIGLLFINNKNSLLPGARSNAQY
jgi:molybdate transport system permease protein